MPNAMLAATPPRRTCRSEVRNDREILSSCSTTSESAKSPSKVMRWSVAMEPVMAICTGRTYPASGCGPRPASYVGPTPTRHRPDGDDEGPDRGGRALASVRRCGSAEGVAAGAAAARVGVVDGEALLLDGVGEVDRGALEVGGAHPVDDDLDTVEVADEVTVEAALVEVELVDQAGAAAGLNTDAEAEVVATLLLEQALDLRRRDVRQDDTVGGSLGLNLGGRCVRLDTHVLVLHVVEHGSEERTHAAPDVFPTSPRIRRPPPESCILPPSGGSGCGRRPGARDACRAVGEACGGLGDGGGDLVGTLRHGIHPGEAGRHGLTAADERLTGDGDDRHTDACGRLGDADDDLPAQRLPVEAALARDDEVGGGHEVGEPDGVEHRLDPGHAARTEQVQGVAEPTCCSGSG